MNNFAFAIEAREIEDGEVPDLEFILNLARNPDVPGDNNRHIARQYAIEITTCIDNNLPFIAYFNKDIITSNVDLDSISNVLVRAGERWSAIPEIEHNLSKEEKLQVAARGGLNPIRLFELNFGKKGIISPKDCEKVERWIDFVKPNYLKRNMSVIKPNNWEDKTTLPDFVKQDKVFIKYLIKRPGGFGRVYDDYDEYLLHVDNCVKYPCIVSEPLDIKTDEHGTVEYRCFMVDHQTSTISRYVDREINQGIPQEISNFANQFAKEHRKKLPPVYVVDVAETNRGLVVVELNPVTNSGRYYGNDSLRFFNDVLSFQKRQKKSFFSFFK